MTDEKIKALFITGNRTGYHPNQIHSTATIEELIAALEDMGEVLGMDAPVYICNDNGYTYGRVDAWNGDLFPGSYDDHHVTLYDEDLY